MIYFLRIMLTAGKIRLLLAIAIVAAVAGIVIMTLKRLPPQGGVSSAVTSEKRDGADLQLRGIRVNEISDGSTKWTLIAEKADYDTGRSEVKLATVRLTVAPFDKSLGELTLTSPTALYHTESRNIFLNGGVKAKSSRGMEFATPSVKFMGGRGVLTTADPVRFTDDELTLEGIGMEYNVESSALKVKRDVTATVRGGKRR